MKVGIERFQDSCAICLEGSLSAFRMRFFSKKGRWKTNDPGVIVGRDCRHLFHYACAEKWLEEHNTCPTCRIPFRPRDVQKELANSVAIRIQQNAEVVPFELIIQLSYQDVEEYLEIVKKEIRNQDGALSPEQVERRRIQYSVLMQAKFDLILGFV